jgi:competence protein ComEC
MALVVIFARLLGRESEALRVLIFVGWLMVMLNPAILLSDVSFQLSFMAALALVVLSPLLEKYFLFVKYKILREIVVTTIATQIFVAPILLYHMGTFSLVGLVANLFVLPIISIAMFFVAAVAVLSFVPLVGSIFAYVAQFLLSYILNIVELGASIPFANVKINSFDILPLTICYGLIYYGCTMLKKKQSVTSK